MQVTDYRLQVIGKLLDFPHVSSSSYGSSVVARILAVYVAHMHRSRIILIEKTCEHRGNNVALD